MSQRNTPFTHQAMDELLGALGYAKQSRNASFLTHLLSHAHGDAGYDTAPMDTDTLIQGIWNTDDPARCKSLRRNLNIIRSTVNKDLSRLYKEGQNPVGVTIDDNFSLAISQEAKEAMYAPLAEHFNPGDMADLGRAGALLDALTQAALQGDGAPSDMTELAEKLKRAVDALESGGAVIPESESPEEEIVKEEPEEIDEDDLLDLEEVPEEELLEEEPEELDDYDIEEIDEDELLDLEEVPEEELLEEEPEELDDVDIEEIDEDEFLDLEEVPEEELLEEEPEELEDSDIEEIDEDDVLDLEEVPEEEILEDEPEELDDYDIEEIDEDDLLDLEEVPEEEIFEDEPEEIEDSDIEEVDEDELLDLEEVPEEEILEDEPEEIEDSDIKEVDEDELLDLEEVPEEEIFEDEAEGPGNASSLSDEEIDEMREKASRFDAMLNESERYYNRTIIVPSGKYPVIDPISGQETMAETQEFLMGKYPVTNALFEVFVSRTGYKTTAEERGFGAVYEPRLTRQTNSRAISISTSRGVRLIRRATWHTPSGDTSSIHTAAHHPVVQVSFEDAQAFAAWSGKALPTLAQWLASGGKNRSPYPWGEAWEAHLCNTEEVGGGGTLSVDTFPAGSSPFGVSDLLGNAMEWLSDRLPERDGEPVKLAAGGSFTSDRTLTRTTLATFDTRFSSNILGFRCSGW